MKITDFAVEVSILEGLKKETNIAQIKECLRVINQLLSGRLYAMIRSYESK